MKKLLFEKQVCFRGSRVSEVDRENQKEATTSSLDLEAGNRGRTRTSTTSHKHDFPFRKVPIQVPVVDVPPLPAKYFRQLPRKDAPAKNKAPIEEGVKAEDILERMLEGEMKVTPKELWAVVPKLRAALKEILTSKWSVKEGPDVALEAKESRPQKNLVSVNCLEEPQIGQESLEVEDGEIVEVWAVADPVLQFLEKLDPLEREYQVFSMEKEERLEKTAPDMAHLRVVPVVINGIGEEEVLLDSGSQIVSMTRKVAAANKVTWDPNLSIQMQSANGSLLRTCRLSRNVLFTLGGVTVLLQVHIMEDAPYTVLLGRPFNSITESQIMNDREGNQMVCITCPNTGTVVTVPTYKRGALPRKAAALANIRRTLTRHAHSPTEVSRV